MSHIVFEAPPRSGDSIENLADAVRAMFGLEDETWFPIVEFVEKGLQYVVEGVEFDVLDSEEMGGRMGAVNPVTRAFMIRTDVYLRAAQGNGRDRFTLAHEAGHAIMHIGTLNRSAPVGKVPTYSDPEWQANRFAAALLMPRRLVAACMNVNEIVQRFGVSRECAEVRVKTLKLNLK